MAFHPQMNGLSERKNQWVEQYLHLVMSMQPEDWTQWLAIATAVHNNQWNSTTGLLPNHILLRYNITLNPKNTTQSTNKTVEEWITLMTEKHAQATAVGARVVLV